MNEALKVETFRHARLLAASNAQTTRLVVIMSSLEMVKQ